MLRLTNLWNRNSCTVLISGRAVCIHDETWKKCEVSGLPEALAVEILIFLKNGHTVDDFVRQIEEEHERLNQ